MFSLYQIFNFLYEFSQQCVYGFVFFRPKSINGFGKIALYVFVCCSFYQFSVYLKRQCLHSHHGDNHIQPLLLPLVCLSDSMACMETRYQKHFVILSVAFEWELDFLYLYLDSQMYCRAFSLFCYYYAIETVFLDIFWFYSPLLHMFLL